MRYVWLFVAASVVIDVSALLVLVSAPEAGTVRGYIVNEDSLIENLTAGIFFCAFLFALVVFTAQGNRPAAERKWLFLLMVLGLACFLDEISFGERLLGLTMPMLGQTKIDSMHDLIQLGIDKVPGPITDYQLQFLFLLLAVLGLFLLAALKYCKRNFSTVIAGKYFPLTFVMVCFFGLVSLALLLDAKLFPFRGEQAVEELLELNAALALLTCCVIVYQLETGKPR